VRGGVLKTKDLWVLDYCIPSHWTNDLTPPEEWDYAAEPGSMSLGDFLGAVAGAFGVAMNEVVEGLKPVLKLIESASYNIVPIIDEINRFDEITKQLDEADLVKNGRYIVKSQNPKVELPTRYTNSGPPERRKWK